jgi:hypothetical protein
MTAKNAARRNRTEDSAWRSQPSLCLYALEKLGEAVNILATHPAAIRFRLRAAIQPLLVVPRNALPPHLRELLDLAVARMTSRRGQDGHISLSDGIIQGMRDKTAVKIAATICRVEAELHSLLLHD